MKKLLSILLAILLIISAIPLGVFSFTAGAATSGYYTYRVSNGAATITVCDTSISGSVTIPSTLGGYPVTSIGYGAFSDCTSLTSVTIPDSVTSIGDNAFRKCTSLTSITIPDSVTSIGDCAFFWCDSLTSITIPDSVTSIGTEAFYWCVSLTSITIPDSVTSIGSQAFYYCSSLASITIPDNVTSIGGWAFYGCTRLTAINVDENNGSYGSVDGVLFNKDKTTLIQYPAGKPDAIYTITDGITSIGNSAFKYCTSLTSITIPDSVTSIGVDAFCYCSSLTSVTIGDSVTSIGNYAFYNCTSLTDVWYAGSETDKQNITISSYNTDLTAATWHYNTCNPSEHTYANNSDTTCENCEWVRELYKPGDINDDTNINNKDLGLLMQFLNDWEVKISLEAADVNDDGNVNNKDYGLLMQYLNGWDVVLK